MYLDASMRKATAVLSIMKALVAAMYAALEEKVVLDSFVVRALFHTDMGIAGTSKLLISTMY